MRVPQARLRAPLSSLASAIGVVIVTLVVVVLQGCGNANKPITRSTVKIADDKSIEASIFRQNCAICHGNEGHGRELAGKLVPSLRSGDVMKKSEQEIYDQIANGKMPMPSFRQQLSDEDIRRMARYIIRDLQGRPDAP